MARRDSSDYTFAAAYIGTYVKKLMSEGDYDRLANAKDLVQAESILQEFGYGEAKELKDGDIEYFIRREQNKLFDLIYNTIPERKELAHYLFPYDYHNVKVCLKSEILGITPSDTYLMSTGDLEWQRVVAMIKERSYEFMPREMKEAVAEATEQYGKSHDPQVIDIIMDKACYKAMLRRATRTGEDFLINIIKKQIDALNLKMFIRLREMGRQVDFFKKVYLDGGNIAEGLFISSYDEPYNQFAERLIPYGFKTAVLDGTNSLRDTGSFNLLEKLLEDTVMEENKKAKYESFGIVPIAGFWHAKEVEIDNLRIVLNGLQIGIKPEETLERLRMPYV